MHATCSMKCLREYIGDSFLEFYISAEKYDSKDTMVKLQNFRAEAQVKKSEPGLTFKKWLGLSWLLFIVITIVHIKS